MRYNTIPIFKAWAPEWLIKIMLFLVLLPSIVLFFLPLANINAAAGYYGSEPADMQFAVALFYAGYVGFYSLERRFFTYFAAKEYFLLFTFLQLCVTYVCYLSNSLVVFFPLRFFQGMLFASTVSLSLSLMFTRLRTERAREISFSVFFGLLICALPFNNFVTADLIDAQNFNIVYKIALFSYIPCLGLLWLCMNKVRLDVRFPLYKLDWQSFVLFSTMLCLAAYVLIFGQEYYWLEDKRISYSLLLLFILMTVYLIRQWAMKRPYLNLQIFRFRNFKVGLLVLFLMYICRFASGISSGLFSLAFRFDPIHVSYINLCNLAGLIFGVIIACCMILQKKPIRYIWLPGFLLLLLFHVRMFFLFDIQGDEFNYFLPLFSQGLGVGLIMVPTIVFTISSVPVSLGQSAAAASLLIRYLGFCVSIALINFYDLFGKSSHYNAFQDHLTTVDPMTRYFLHKQSAILLAKGLSHQHAANGSYKMLVSRVNSQDYIRFGMDYYEMMSWLIVGLLLLITLFPYLNRTVLYLRSKRLAPA